ncbi:MAG: ATP cone domain-containing protein [Clostridium sp.]|uniref:ATP cone domain-containing protein n=1 Tax=Clostridium sp. TaxID=1506 RepID=UPI003F2AB9BE
MRVAKRDNEVVPFDFGKLKKSIEGAFMDANYSYTESDLQLVSEAAKDILREITKDCRAASYKEVIDSCSKALKNNGFTSIEESYKKIYITDK